jgi:CBS domain containing-hemolysin-like protein
MENITGYVFRQSVLEKITEKKSSMKLKTLKRDILIVHESLTLLTVWERLLEKKEHIALIIDEYGGMEGIVTMEDIIETLIGFEIMDEMDTVTDMRVYARKRWEEKQRKYNLLDQARKKEE